MTIEIEQILPILEKEVKDYTVPIVDLIAIQTKDPFKVLVATILSARTKDEITAKASERLFKKAPDIETLAALSEEELRTLIYPVGFYKSKAGYLNKLPQALEKFNYQVPNELEKLISLPGVGRKTANLVLAVAFQKDAICVDTHVHRIMNIWGYVKTKTPLETEMALRKKLPKQYWQTINSTLVSFGQGCCRPVSPHCNRCVIYDSCPRLGVKTSNSRTPFKRTSSDSKLFLSWNVNGIRAAEKKGFIDKVKQLTPDIIAIQETKAHPDQLSKNLKNIDGYYSYWHSAERKGYSGVATYSKKEPLNILYGLEKKEFDQEGRVLTLEFDDYYLLNAYFPNAQHELLRIDYKIRFNDTLLSFANKLNKNKSVVICGDFNVAHKPIDLKNPDSNTMNPGFSEQERQWMDKFIDAGYIDTFRKFNQNPNQYSWWSYRYNARERNIGWRIDYFCVDKNSNQRVSAAGIMPEIMGSDHCPVSLEFQ